MDDLISRQAAIDAAVKLAEARRRWGTSEGQAEIRGIDALMCAIEDLPSADVQPVRHGKWIMQTDPYGFFDEIPVCDGYADDNPVYCEWICSECGCVFEDEEPTYNYCPKCGARMVNTEGSEE